MKPFIPDKLPIQSVEWESLIPLIGRANREIATFDGVLYAVPNPEVLLSPLSTREAVLSSRIEGTRATLGDVFRYEAGEEPEQESRRSDINEILNYRTALRFAERELKKRPFNINTLLQLHATLLDSVRGRDKARGFFRREQNWIGPAGSAIEAADFVPPPPEIVREYLEDWEKYYHLDRPDPLVQLAILHAQFEIIHPFLDGNGRIGRLIIPLFLFERQILSRPMFYLSEYLEEHRDEYTGRLRALGQSRKSWNDWIRFFLTAMIAQAQTNTERARKIIDLYGELKTRVVELTHSQFAVPILDRLFMKPVFTSNQIDLGERNPSRQLMSYLLRILREDGIIRIGTSARGARPAVYLFPRLLNLCEGSEIY